MRRPNTTITLPVERLAQLKLLADQRGLSLVETVEQLINEAAATGAIPDELPGYRVSRTAEGRVVLTIGDRPLAALGTQQALTLADLFEGVADRSAPGGKAVTIGTDELKIARVGRGVVLAVEGATGPISKRTMTPGMAKDLARHIRREASA